jgi:hypothetical protein
MIAKVSLIIPYLNNKNIEKLNFLLNAILNGKCVPKEIILVYSYKKTINISNSLIYRLKKKKIIIKKFYKKKMYPGEARNHGIKKARNKIICFLDLETIPNKNWFLEGMKSLKLNDVSFGQTVCSAHSYRDKIIRASTIGSKVLLTIPGSFLKKKIFLLCGLFVENVKAGEDGDLISRMNLHNIKSNSNIEKIIYNAQNNKTYKEILKKWYLNYSHAKNFPHIVVQKKIYYLPISLLLIIISFNWNRLLSQWNEESPIYIANITKITIFITIIFYIILRGIIFPLKKNEKFFFILPFNFLIISFFSFLLDICKLLAFFNIKKK